MTNRFLEDNRANDIRRWLEGIDLRDANILGVERTIYQVLAQSSHERRWDPIPIAPLAEPVDLNALVGDLFNDARDEIKFHTRRVDNFFKWLSETNNSLKADLEASESMITQATDDIQEVALVIGDPVTNFYWVSDSFNSPVFVDTKRSTVLVDTDYGMVTLAPANQFIIRDWEVKVDTSETKGIPGANLLVLDIKTVGNPDQEPEITPESESVRDLGNALDGDSSTWFEVERNFIPPQQRVVRLGRAFVYSPSGNLETVKEITKDLDWRVSISWPGQVGADLGSSGKGFPLAEFRDLSSLDSIVSLPQKSENNLKAVSNTTLEEFAQLASKVKQWNTGKKSDQPDEYDPDIAARLTLEVTLNTPQPISTIKILPFVRGDQPVRLDGMQVQVEDTWLDVAVDIELGTKKSTTRLENEILRRTGIQSTGSIFPVPTNRDITKIRMSFSALPEETKKGLYHPFQENHVLLKTTRKLFGISSTRTRKKWQRVPVYTNTPSITSTVNTPKILGSLATPLAILGSLGNYFNSVNDNRARDAIKKVNLSGSAPGDIGAVAGDLNAISGAISAAKIGGTIGSVGTFLGGAAPIIGGLLAIGSLVPALFGTKKTAKLLSQKVGVDIFKGYRAAVGLRDITFMRTVYASQSVLVTTKRVFPGPVSRIGLFVDENIPVGWGPGDWIEYFISTDGDKWEPIPKLSDVSIEKAYVPRQPVVEVYLMAIIRGDAEDYFRSPHLNHYVLQGLPA